MLDAYYSHIVAIDLDSGDRTVYVDQVADGQERLALMQYFTLDVAGERMMVVDGGATGLYGFDEFPWDTALYDVDLVTGERVLVSENSLGAGVSFATPRGAALDAAHDRLLVTDDTLGAVIAVDMSTGDRVVISDETTGNDIFPYFSNSHQFQGIVIDAVKNRALVADPNNDALISVDLTTGDRDQFSGGRRGPEFSTPTGVAIDTESLQVLVTDAGLDAVVGVNLVQGHEQTLTSLSFSGNDTGIVIDSSNDRAIVVDSVAQQLVSVDLATGLRGLVSTRALGTGVDFEDIEGIAMDSDNNLVYVSDDLLNALIAVDLATGDRAIVSDFSMGSGGVYYHSPNVLVTEVMDNKALLIDTTTQAVYVVDIVSGDRVMLSM